jgi:predicted nucleotidyltransferase
LALKTTGIADVLRDALAPFVKRIRVAFIYGSLTRGEECAASDVDLLVVGNVKFAEVVSALSPVQETLGREINPTVYPSSEFKSKLAGGHHFLKTVVHGNKVFLIGDKSELERLAGKSVAR